MATQQVLAVFDTATRSFMRPFYFPHVGGAVRSFIDEVNSENPDGVLNKHPEDYELHLLASFDEETGVFENVSPEMDVVLIRGKDAVRPK